MYVSPPIRDVEDYYEWLGYRNLVPYPPPHADYYPLIIIIDDSYDYYQQITIGLRDFTDEQILQRAKEIAR